MRFSLAPLCLVSCCITAAAAGVMVWGALSWHTSGPLIPFERLSTPTYLRIAGHVHLFTTMAYPSSNDFFMQNHTMSQSSNKIKLVSEHDKELTVLLPESPDRNHAEHEGLWWNRRFASRMQLPTKCVRDVNKSTRTLITEECFKHHVESMSWRIKIVLMAWSSLTVCEMKWLVS